MRPTLMAALIGLGLVGCGDSAGSEDSAAASDVDENRLLNLGGGPGDDGDLAGSPDKGSAPKITLAAGPDVCFREIAKSFGPDVRVSEITSFFGGGDGLDSVVASPRGEMTSCSVNFQNPKDPRKLLSARFDMRSGRFGEPQPMEITVMGGNASDFRLDDYVVPLSRINAAALSGVMQSQEKRLKSVYSDYAWTGVRLSSPGAFSRTHTLRLDLSGRLAANDIKESGYASVSLDGRRIVTDHLLP